MNRGRWPRRLLRIAVALTAGLFLLAIAIFAVLRTSLPPVDGTLPVAGLRAPATIERDALGVPTIRAASRNDLAFATGFAHASDRFFQMDLARRQAAGELSVLAGDATLALDRRHRLHRFRARARRVVGAASAQQRGALDSYTAGVNAGLAALGARPFEYLLLGASPEPWLPEDSVLVLYSMFLALHDSRATRDLDRALVQASLEPAAYALLYPRGTRWDAPLDGSAAPEIDLPGAGQLDLRTRAPASGSSPAPRPVAGSNNWAVAGALAADGRAIVANDMHLELRVPNIWYRARLQTTAAPPLDLAGVTLPGTPWLVAGSNGTVAWGFTNSYGDWVDLVALEPGSGPSTYRSSESEHTMEEIEETLHVNGARPVTLIVRETIWGPVLEGLDDLPGDYALQWTAQEPEAVNLALMGLEQAESVAAALDHAAQAGIPAQNFVVADSGGSIGWTLAGRIPDRMHSGARTPLASSRLPPRSLSFVAPADHPRIVNPDDGILWTANSRVVGGAALALIGDGDYALGARATQIRDTLVSHRRPVGTSDMLAMQLDDRVVALERWQALLVQVLDNIPREPGDSPDGALAGVRDWSGRATVDSAEYTLIRSFRAIVMERLHAALVEPLVARYGEQRRPAISRQFDGTAWRLAEARPAHLLPAGHADWQAFLAAAAHAAVERSGASRWGQRNRAAIRHPLSAAVPLIGHRLDMPAQELPGDALAVRVQAPSFGASERFAVAPGAEAEAYFHMPAGQSGHPLSPFYRAGHSAWAAGLPESFLPGPRVHSLELVPKD